MDASKYTSTSPGVPEVSEHVFFIGSCCSLLREMLGYILYKSIYPEVHCKCNDCIRDFMEDYQSISKSSDTKIARNTKRKFRKFIKGCDFFPQCYAPEKAKYIKTSDLYILNNSNEPNIMV